MIDGDEGAGTNHVVAPRRHGNVGDAAGHASVSPAVAREAALRPPRVAPEAGQSRTPEAAPRGLAVRHAGGVAPAGGGRNCRYRDRNGGGFVLTVGAGLGYGPSGEPGVRSTLQRRERTGEQVGDCGPCGRPDQNRMVGGRGRGGCRVRGDRRGPSQGRGRADRRVPDLRHQEPPRPHGAQSEDRREPEHRRLDRTDIEGRQAVAGCRQRGRVVMGMTGDRGQAGTGGAAC